MAGQALGTITGRTGAGAASTIVVSKDGDGIEFASNTLERRHVALRDAADVDRLLAAAAELFGLSDVRFIPAHGATGGRSPDEHLGTAAAG